MSDSNQATSDRVEDDDTSRPRRGSLEGVFQELCECAEGDKVTVGAILDGLAHRSYGPLLLFPSVIAVLPVVGALPGVSMAMAGLALLISVHFLINRRTLWLPRKVRNFEVSSSKFRKGMEWGMPTFRFIDGFLDRRFQIMLRSPWPFLLSLLCVLLSLAMGVGALVPGGIVLPALALAVIAVGLTAHDGLVLALGGLISMGGMWGLWSLVF
ncbi:exopolysaccharide biosynthesis protein [Maricaulis sp. CAU 1757]